jgi:hypothetical protein
MKDHTKGTEVREAHEGFGRVSESSSFCSAIWIDALIRGFTTRDFFSGIRVDIELWMKR